MMIRKQTQRKIGIGILGLALVLAARPAARAQQVEPQFYAAMRWRSIGPFRGGRALAVTGVPGEPNVYYFGSVGGGVWKSTNAGLTWMPLFQHEGTASIGAIAVAPSDPNVIYAGTGETDMRSDISIGDGIYKSTDAGRTWTPLGLAETRQIAKILVDPRNPNVVLVAALGHAYGPNAERGVFRSTDGGHTWRKVLYKDENTGAIDLAFAPGNPSIVYAALWQTRRPAWSQYAPLGGPGGGIYKSNDGGATWQPLAGHGLPAGPLGRIGLAVAPGDRGERVYALIDCHQGGLYRSDDGGSSWQQVSKDPRIWSRDWYFGGVTVDPKNANVVWIPNVALYRSTDGGRQFDAVKGAPGGDDYHALWIDPADSTRMILGSDQGTVISLDGGRTWSSWYNQPTAQFYHVATDHRIPYWVYGAQQDSGTAGTPSRSDYGSISFRDWHPVGGGESGYIVPDPADPAILYAGDTYGALHKWDARTTQSETITPWLVGDAFASSIDKRKYRFTWTSPLAFSPQNPHLLYYGAQVLLETIDGGSSWRAASPDLTVLPGAAAQPRRAVIYTIAPSVVRAGEIWVGTDNGLIQLTLDGGKSWNNVTPPAVGPWSKISLIEASRFDAGVAYAAVDRHRLDDYAPYIWRTRDYGKTWTPIAAGLTAPGYVHAVREDPARRGLLYAGTETGAYVSFDDGGHWQSLQLNLPRTPIHDLAIEQGDLIAATHGRAFWILDDLSPLRQLTAEAGASTARLFKPRLAYRFQRSTNTDTPFPPEEPAGRNPPDGAILYYWLGAAARGPVTLEILDAAGKLVRRYSSADKPTLPDVNQFAVAPYWMEAPAELSAGPGMHRFVWDLRYPPPDAATHDFPIAAIPHATPQSPQGPVALPGRYTVRLTVAGQTQTQPLEVRMDPRVKTAPAGLQAQLALARELTGAMDRSFLALDRVRALRRRLAGLPPQAATGPAGEAVSALDHKLAGLDEGEGSLAQLNDRLSTVLDAVESADAPPTDPARQAWAILRQELDRRLAAWQEIQTGDLPRLNQALGQAGLGAASR
ncbi:MAG TPA: hypothetical protein VGS20_11275 [Candidatus Acidoferrales bacterium]|nr:hypothetical protein [Candidatus Acidoferrales bacterium]